MFAPNDEQLPYSTQVGMGTGSLNQNQKFV